MARISYSALLTDARGKISSVVFSRWRGLATVRSLITPRNPRTPLQIAVRSFLHAATRSWARQTTLYKSQFGTAAAGLAESGFNRFIREAYLFDPEFRDFRSLTTASATLGATSVVVAATAPPTSPVGLDTLGFLPGSLVHISTHAQVYTITAVAPLTNTLTISPGLEAAIASDVPVVSAGPAAPATAPFTLRPS